MARFYARFDSGSESTLDNNFFERRRIGAGSASAALLRDGLISSRSVLSTDIYADLDGVNKDASRGTYFPPDSGPFSTDGSTFVSWSTAYTSSVDGIKFPVTNSYGSATVINYSKRPTASILSTMTPQLVTASVPNDPVGASYTTYINATNAVNTVLNLIQDATTTLSTPYTRPGTTPSRTVHSIWHDPDLQYFAWDDFTPGTPQNFALTIPERVFDPVSGYYRLFVESTDNINTVFTWNRQFLADLAGTASLTASFIRDSDSTTITTLNQNILGGPTFYSWSQASTSYGNDVNGVLYDIDSNLKFKDAIISSHTGGTATDFQNQYVQIFKVTAITNMRTSGVGFCNQQAVQQALCDDTTNETVYVDSSGIFSTTQYLYTLKDGTLANQGLYAPAGQNINGGTARCWDGAAFESDVTLVCT